jgi:hypothetical protein
MTINSRRLFKLLSIALMDRLKVFVSVYGRCELTDL